MNCGKKTPRTSIKVYFSKFFAKLGKFQALLEPEWSSREARRPPGAAPPSGRAGHPPDCPGHRLRLHLGSEPSFCCRNFCYIFARIVPAPYLAISCVFSFGLFLPGKKPLIGDVFLWLERRRLYGSSSTTTPARLQSKEVRRMGHRRGDCCKKSGDGALREERSQDRNCSTRRRCKQPYHGGVCPTSIRSFS